MDRLRVRIQTEMGLRPNEVSRIRQTDLCSGGRELLVHGKGGRQRVLEVPRTLREVLASAIEQSEGRPFRGTAKAYTERWNRACRLTSVDHVGRGTHGLRHTFAQEWFEKSTANPSRVPGYRSLRKQGFTLNEALRSLLSEQLGHNRLNVTYYYVAGRGPTHSRS